MSAPKYELGILEFLRDIGIEVTPWQERMLKVWEERQEKGPATDNSVTRYLRRVGRVAQPDSEEGAVL